MKETTLKDVEKSIVASFFTLAFLICLFAILFSSYLPVKKDFERIEQQSKQQNEQIIYRLQQQENELYNLNNQIRELKQKEK